MPPDLGFHGQPLAEPHATGAVLRRLLAHDDVASIDIAVAWARFGGLARLAPELRTLSTRGCSSRLIVGIDEGVATRPGLALALELFDEVAILHDLGGRTFHPKLYVINRPGTATVVLGSSNLTAAGLYFNFEASLEADFELPLEAEHPALVGIRDYLQQLRTDSACRIVTHATLDEVANDPRYRIAATERRRTSPSPAPGVEADEIDAPAGTEDPSVFARSSHAVTFPPPLSDADRARLRALEGPVAEEPDEAAAPQRGGPVVAAEARVSAESWTKVLSATDAQHPPQFDSNPTGNLRLSQAGNPIDHRTWFRYDFFGTAAWLAGTDSRGNQLETATIPMAVHIGGADLGVIDIRVDHAPHREAGQNNVPTVLHWGSTLLPVLRGVSYAGSAVTLERSVTGSFSLRIE